MFLTGHPLRQSAQYRHGCQETHVFRSVRVPSQTSKLTYHRHWSHIDSITYTLNQCLPNIWLQFDLFMFLNFIVAGATRLNYEVNQQWKIHQLNVDDLALTNPDSMRQHWLNIKRRHIHFKMWQFSEKKLPLHSVFFSNNTIEWMPTKHRIALFNLLLCIL